MGVSGQIRLALLVGSGSLSFRGRGYLLTGVRISPGLPVNTYEIMLCIFSNVLSVTASLRTPAGSEIQPTYLTTCRTDYETLTRIVIVTV